MLRTTRSRLSFANAVSVMATLVGLGGACFGLATPPADAQEPVFTATAGQQFSGSGRALDPISGDCTDVRDVLIQWRDGTQTPATAASLELDAVDVGGSPIPIYWVRISGSHVYRDLGTAYRADVQASYTATCLNSDKQPYDFHETNVPIFSVQVQPGSGAGTSCPSPFAGISASVGPRALASQAPCTEPKKRFNDEQKFVIRVGVRICLAGAAVDGIFALLASRGPSPVIKASVPIYVVRGIAFGFCAGVLGDLYNDPPDPDYRSVASPPKIKSQRVPARLKRSDELNRYLSSLERSASLGAAVMTAIERAQGATVAGNKTFEKRQMLAAADYASQLAAAMEDVASERAGAARALSANGLKPNVSEAEAAKAQAKVAKDGLPTAITKQYSKLGSALAGYLRQGLLQGIANTKPADMAEAVEKGTDERKMFNRLATMLRSFAKQVKRDPLASQ
jgi:hypothetical protein